MASTKKRLKGSRPYQPNLAAHTADQVADWFLARLDTNAGDTISPLKLQKLVYYAQAWHLVVFNQLLFSEPIQAWVHGPVVPSLYQRFKDNCRDCLIGINTNGLEKTNFSTETEDLLNEVYSIYGEHSASYLEELTHREMPWIMARKGLPLYQRSEEVITVESMIDYYKALKNGKKHKSILSPTRFNIDFELSRNP
ncbi:SocA family protein [Chitinophaga sp. G-6-1-13]|uniref:SocA family protein n=2 Tax=Chitinophaga fulva TaxID=2728842 RepID=A0A848GWI3_9BACT|nr:SocA family protein [Chitinophaga fulva]